MKHVICKCNVKTDGRKYLTGDYANISDELYAKYGEEMFQLIEDLPGEDEEPKDYPE